MQGLGSRRDRACRQRGDKSARYLPRVASGEAIAAFALSEPDAGSDVAALACRARADGDGYVLDGEKTWISNGGIADFYVRVRAHRAKRRASRGITRVHRRCRTRRASRSPSGSTSSRRIRSRACASAMPHSGVAAARRRGRGLQARDAHARHLSHVGRRCGAGLRPPRARRGAGARDARAACSAAFWPTCSLRRRSSRKWRPRSTPRRCSPIARRGCAIRGATRHARGGHGQDGGHRGRAAGHRRARCS